MKLKPYFALACLPLYTMAQDDLAPLSDEFDHPSSILQWQRIHETEGWNANQLERWEVDTSRVGHMTFVPYASSWYENYRGVLAFKEVTGDFIATTEVIPRNRSESGAPGRSYSLSGIMARAPRPEVVSPETWTPGGEDYVFLSLGTASDPGTYQFEVKTTNDSVSNLEISDGYPKARLRLARIGDAVIVLLKPDGQDWRIHRRYNRPDFPETMQVGITVYTDWNSANAMAPLIHNQTVNTGGQPDLVANFNFYRYSRPEVPEELAELDLANPEHVDETTLLEFLGFESVPNSPTEQKRINHEGRILGKTPEIAAPTLFNTALGDNAISSLQVFPRNHGWNEDISTRSTSSHSDAMIAQVKSDLAASRQTLRPFYEMNYVLVPEDQAPESIEFTLYGEESEPSPYPIPDNTPVEGWPRTTGELTLEQWQQDLEATGGDRHSIILQPSTGDLFETWQMRRVEGDWQASNGARFNLNDNLQRPAGWTSADAGGHSMLGGLVRFDECERGMVEHAIRLIVSQTRREYLYPANHFASNSDLATRPAMGERFRLKEEFEIPDSWTIYEKAVCKALKKYGAIVMDNGGFFSISVAPDDRFPDEAFDNVSSIDIDQFEVVDTSAATEGPRSNGAPAVEAGNGKAVPSNSTVALQGQLHDPSGSATTEWYLYEGPADISIANSAQLEASVHIDTEGLYTFMLRATDGIHSPAFDAVTILVSDSLSATASALAIEIAEDDSRIIRYTREEPPLLRYSLETSSNLFDWSVLEAPEQVDSIDQGTARIHIQDAETISNNHRFYRIKATTD